MVKDNIEKKQNPEDNSVTSKYSSSLAWDFDVSKREIVGKDLDASGKERVLFIVPFEGFSKVVDKFNEITGLK